MLLDFGHRNRRRRWQPDTLVATFIVLFQWPVTVITRRRTTGVISGQAGGVGTHPDLAFLIGQDIEAFLMLVVTLVRPKSTNADANSG
jgi:hypothetical protein